MSRIGKEPITLPQGVTVNVNGNDVVVKGGKGELNMVIDPAITVNVNGNVVTLTRADDTDAVRAKHGLYRALLKNMVVGVSDGYARTLVVNGVGWKVNKQGNKLVMGLGFSHPVEYAEPKGITFECPDQNTIVVKGIDKCEVGQVAADIRAIREPEPYHGYGIRYSDEVIERKEGKTAGK